MVDIKTLLPELRDLVGELAEDLLARSTETADIDAGLRKAFQQIEKGGRTAQAFEVWRTDYLDQVAVTLDRHRSPLRGFRIDRRDVQLHGLCARCRDRR